MFGFGKKKPQVADDQRIYAPVAGELLALADVSDPVFAQGMMGEGFAIEPVDGVIVSPVAGEVTMLQPHAVGLKRADGLEFLVHMGIDTVGLNGDPFELAVKIGDVVAGGDTLATVDWTKVDAAGLPKTTMVLITNSKDALGELTINQTGKVPAGEPVGLANIQ